MKLETQRQIKIRAWDIEREQWWIFTLHPSEEGANRADHIGLFGTIADPRLYSQLRNWGQWISLIDKNGREIYEGDIVRQIYKQTFYLVTADMWNLRRDLEETGGVLEVIGNIYENLELLKDSEKNA